jgi:GT2 family glycosyltransferase
MRTLHILTLNWNGEDKLMKLIPSLNKAVKAVRDTDQWEVVWYVRDNGSKDNSIKALKEYRHSIQIHGIEHNRASFSEGVNFLQGEANPATCDMLMLLNNDVEFRDDQSILKMLELQKKTQADVVGARLLFTGTNKLQHAGVIFSQRYNTLPYHFRPNEESDENAKRNRWFQAVTAACCLVRADSFCSIGGMDEGFRWAFDDIDMCLSIKNNGGKIAYCGETEIWHEESASLKKNPVNKMFVGKNVERFRKKWNGKYEIDHDMYLGNPKYNEIK